jgi:hypothetical protein
MNWLTKWLARAQPWAYGPYRVVVQRRVTEEEQISIEAYEPTLGQARSTYDSFMESMRRNMILHNERVWAVNQKQMGRLERMIEVRGENVRALDAAIRERREWLLERGLPLGDIPLFEDEDEQTNGPAS